MRRFLTTSLALGLLAACSDGGDSSATDAGEDAEVGRPADAAGDVVPDGDDDVDAVGDVPESETGADGDASDADETSHDVGGDTGDGGSDDAGDTGTDVVADAGDDATTCTTDNDRDRHIARECGGDDCDDNDPLRYPGSREFCDFVDNNCNNIVNDGVECTFLAHSNTNLYRVDPFTGITEDLGEIPSILDIDVSNDGIIYGVSRESLFYYDDRPSVRRWNAVGTLGRTEWAPNGFAIDSRGRGYLTSADELWSVDLREGRATLIGRAGSGYVASGDCVVNKDDTIYMSSKHLDDTDTLIRLDGATGRGTEIGPIGFTRVFGLTAAWGFLFGLTRDGQIVQIDSTTGEGVLLHTTPGISWYGAASGAER